MFKSIRRYIRIVINSHRTFEMLKELSFSVHASGFEMMDTMRIVNDHIAKIEGEK